MSGQASAVDLAGVAIGSSLWIPILTAVNGIVLAITPIIAQLIGAKEKKISRKLFSKVFTFPLYYPVLSLLQASLF